MFFCQHYLLKIIKHLFNTFAITRYICVTQQFVLRARRHIRVTLLIRGDRGGLLQLVLWFLEKN